MEQKHQKQNPALQTEGQREVQGRTFLRLGVICALVLAAAALGHRSLKPHQAPSARPHSPALTAARDAADDLASAVVREATSAVERPGDQLNKKPSIPRRPAAVSASNSPILPAVRVPSELPASAIPSKQLISSIAQPDQPLTRERASEIKQSIAQIISQGPAAIPAIAQFLEKSQDLSFADSNGHSLVGYDSLRAALFDSLRQIGGAEAESVLLTVLRTTADPVEVSLLARTLDAQAPGQYRSEVLNATRETLDQIIAGQLSVGDVGPLFQVLQSYGDASVLADLQRTQPRWANYATMALAGLPDGQGIPALVQLAQGPTGDRFALQMLAQVAGTNPDAGVALVEQARLNQIPDRAWPQIATGLAGDQYQLQRPIADPSSPNQLIPGSKSYHIPANNQNFFSAPITADLPADEIARRQELIGQLLALARGSVASQALQNARAQLSALHPKP